MDTTRRKTVKICLIGKTYTIFFFLSDEGYITKGYLKCDAHLPSMAPKIDKLNS